MRVALVNQDPGIALGRQKGAAVHLEAMRAALAGQGAEVTVLQASDPTRLRSLLERTAARGTLGLVYERYALGRSASAHFCAERRVPLVLEVNAPLAEEELRWRERPEGEAEREADRFLFGQATAVVAVSRLVADYAVARGCRAQCVTVFPNGVDGDRFVPRSEDCRVRAGLVPAGRFALGFHGRLRPWHRFDRLVRVCARLLQRGLPVQLVAVGAGDFEAALGGWLPREHCTLVGWKPHDEVPRYVAAFDALPLTYDGAEPCYFSPLKLAEAMACGVVPVVPELGDLPGVVGDAGIVYPADDMDRLVEVLARLAASPVSRRSLARLARLRSAELSWERVATFVLGHARREARP